MTYGELVVGGTQVSGKTLDIINSYKERIATLINDLADDYVDLRREAVDGDTLTSEESFNEIGNRKLLMKETMEKAIEHLELSSVFMTKSFIHGQNISRTFISSASKSKE